MIFDVQMQFEFTIDQSNTTELADLELLTRCILIKFSHTIYWKSPISILDTPGYEIYIFLEKNS